MSKYVDITIHFQDGTKSKMTDVEIIETPFDVTIVESETQRTRIPLASNVKYYDVEDTY